MHVADTLHHLGLTIILISVMAKIGELILVSREPSWLSWVNKITPYSLWAGVLLVFVGIIVWERNRRRPDSK